MTFRQPVLAATALLMSFTMFMCARLCHLRTTRTPGRSSYAMKNKDYLSF